MSWLNKLQKNLDSLKKAAKPFDPNSPELPSPNEIQQWDSAVKNNLGRHFVSMKTDEQGNPLTNHVASPLLYSYLKQNFPQFDAQKRIEIINAEAARRQKTGQEFDPRAVHYFARQDINNLPVPTSQEVISHNNSRGKILEASRNHQDRKAETAPTQPKLDLDLIYSPDEKREFIKAVHEAKQKGDFKKLQELINNTNQHIQTAKAIHSGNFDQLLGQGQPVPTPQEKPAPIVQQPAAQTPVAPPAQPAPILPQPVAQKPKVIVRKPTEPKTDKDVDRAVQQLINTPIEQVKPDVAQPKKDPLDFRSSEERTAIFNRMNDTLGRHVNPDQYMKDISGNVAQAFEPSEASPGYEGSTYKKVYEKKKKPVANTPKAQPEDIVDIASGHVMDQHPEISAEHAVRAAMNVRAAAARHAASDQNAEQIPSHIFNDLVATHAKDLHTGTYKDNAHMANPSMFLQNLYEKQPAPTTKTPVEKIPALADSSNITNKRQELSTRFNKEKEKLNTKGTNNVDKNTTPVS